MVFVQYLCAMSDLEMCHCNCVFLTMFRLWLWLQIDK
jgi:hypothetical protein